MNKPVKCLLCRSVITDFGATKAISFDSYGQKWGTCAECQGEIERQKRDVPKKGPVTWKDLFDERSKP